MDDASGPERPLGAGSSDSHVQAAHAVKGVYERLKDAGVAGRVKSSILHLRNFNNWIKAVLIAEYAPKPCRRVLDLACGKCGDLNKWLRAGVTRYCGVDISLRGVRDGAARFNSVAGGSGGRGFGGGGGGGAGGPVLAKLARADLGATNLRAAGLLAPDEHFDAVSIQFALHYLFANERRALAFFRNVADVLAPGGVLLGTIPDAAYLIRRLRDLPLPPVTAVRPMPPSSRDPEGSSSSSAWPSEGTRGPHSWGNEHYSVTFDAAAARRQWCLGDNPYGVGYDFYLTGAVDHATEYLVPWPLLERLAAAAGLRPLASDNFHAFFDRMRTSDPKHAALLRTMKAVDCEGALSKGEWEVAGVYRVFAFQRVESEAEVAARGGPCLPPVDVLFPSGVKPAPPHMATPAIPAAAGAGAGAGFSAPLTSAQQYRAAVAPHHIVDMLAEDPAADMAALEAEDAAAAAAGGGAGGGDDE